MRGPGDRFEGAPAAWLLLAAVALLLFWPLVLGRAHLVPFHVFAGDPALAGLDARADRPDWATYDTAPVTVQYAEKTLVALSLRQGELPLWNPYNGLGFPLLADGQSQPLAPFFLPFLAWPTPWVYSLVLVAQLVFGGVGMERLLRALGCGAIARVMGALLFAFNPYTLKYVAYSDVWAYVWFPWVFWAAWRMAQEPRSWRGFAVSVALMGMSGHPEEAFMGAAAGFLFYGVWALAGGGWHALARPAPLAAPAAALLLSTWWVAPFLEWVKGSWSPRMGSHVPHPYDPSACFLSTSELLWLPPLLLLALAGCRRRAALALAPALAWAALLLFPWPASVHRLADLGFMSGRYARSLAWFGLTVLAAMGLEAWRRADMGLALRWVGTGLVAAWSAGALLVLSAGAGGGEGMVPLAGSPAAASVPVWLLTAAGLALWWAPRPWLERRGPWLAGLFAVVAVAGGLLHPPGTWASWNRSQPALSPSVKAVVPAGGGRQWFPSEGLRMDLCPSLSAAFGVRDVRYVSPLTPRRMRPLVGDMRLGFSGFLDWSPEVLDFAGVAAAWRRGEGSLKPLPNPAPLPRGFWVGRARPAGDPLDAVRGALEGGAWRREALLEVPTVTAGTGAVEALPATLPGEPLDDACNVSIWRVEAPRAGWFVLRDLFWPGWRVTVDGAAAPLLAADGVFRAVALPAGRHLVAFTYRPLSVVAGAILSLLTVLALALSRRRGRPSLGARP